MTVRGIGIDIADIARFDCLWRRGGERFAARWFTGAEIAVCLSRRAVPAALAEHFAVKEAVWKALSPPAWSHALVWRDIAFDARTGSVTLRGRPSGWAPECQVNAQVRSDDRVAVATAIAWQPEVSAT
ncbi:holo-ACP synthase [Microbacterium aurum]